MNGFIIKCKSCGSECVSIMDYHNEYEEGKRMKCRECGNKEDI